MEKREMLRVEANHPFYANKLFPFARVVFNVFKRKIFFML